jgi:hypothetical protein
MKTEKGGEIFDTKFWISDVPEYILHGKEDTAWNWSHASVFDIHFKNVYQAWISEVAKFFPSMLKIFQKDTFELKG